METFKFFLVFLLSIVLGFSVWYGIFYFIILDFNFTNWHWATRLLYLILSVQSVSSLMSEYNK
jgi:hypothetical protein